GLRVTYVQNVTAEEVYLLLGQVPPVHIGLGGTFQERVVDIGDVLYVGHAQPGVGPGAVQRVEGHIGEGVPEVGGVIRRDAAHVQPRGVALDRIGERPGCGVPQLRPDAA